MTSFEKKTYESYDHTSNADHYIYTAWWHCQPDADRKETVRNLRLGIRRLEKALVAAKEALELRNS